MRNRQKYLYDARTVTKCKKMNKFTIKIAQQLTIGVSILVLLPIFVLYFVTHSIIERNTYAQTEADLSRTAATQSVTIEATYRRVLSKVSSDLIFAEYVLSQSGDLALDTESTVPFVAKNQMTGATQEIVLPRLSVGTDPIAFDYTIVDIVQRHVGGTATIFQAFPGGLLRISTNVRADDGARAVGTYIPTDSPVYETVMRGETFYGRAFVVNQWYITAYKPLRSTSGEIIGVLYVGVPELEYREELLTAMSEVRIGETGYVYVLDDDGVYILSNRRERDGENISSTTDTAGTPIIQEMISLARSLEPSDTALYRYYWQNAGEASPREKVASVTYFEPWHWTIGVGDRRFDHADRPSSS